AFDLAGRRRKSSGSCGTSSGCWYCRVVRSTPPDRPGADLRLRKLPDKQRWRRRPRSQKAGIFSYAFSKVSQPAEFCGREKVSFLLFNPMVSSGCHEMQTKTPDKFLVTFDPPPDRIQPGGLANRLRRLRYRVVCRLA